MSPDSKPHSADPVKAFRSPLLERLSRVHPIVPICIWGPVSVGLVILGLHFGVSPASVAGLALAGLVFWTFVEYLLHRWVFHWEPRSPRLREFLYPMHNLHHDVQEWDRLVAPPLLAIPLWMTILGICWVVLGSPTIFPFFGGFTIGYLGYDYIHYYTHFGETPKSKIGQALRRRHLQHHFACNDRWYGVSSPLWDFVFRTHLRHDEKPSQEHY